mmetsp:Transcript_17103/g.20595  ORF Transcript_17103/g.20595 Transcript_17103/m.20595 type:complete len:365 (-) Transcript_17103:308-1402(-)
MTIEECVQLAGLPLCGYRGTCFNQTDCLCDPGWSQNNEFAWYLAGEFDGDVTSIDRHLICDTNQTLLFWLYSVAGSLNVMSFAAHFSKVQRITTLLRIFPFLLSQLTIAIYCYLRMQAKKDRKLGEDSVTTVLFAIQNLAGLVTASVFFSKFMLYQAKSSPLAAIGSDAKRTRYLASSLTRTQNFMFFLDAVSTILLLASAFIRDFNVDAVILKAWLGVASFRMLYTILCTVYFPNLILADLGNVYEQLKGQLRYSSSGKRMKTYNETAEAHLKKVKKNMTHLRTLKLVILPYCCFLLWFNTVPLLWDMWYNVYKYFLPLGFSLGPLTYLVVLSLVAAQKKIRSGFSTSSTTSGAKSSFESTKT